MRSQIVINAQRLHSSGLVEEPRLLTITHRPSAHTLDTDQEAVPREATLLMQELRHRIANSLQIIASVLNHGARHAGSQEARSSLLDGYHRIMAVATVQQQLAISCRGDVVLRPYLTELCDCIAASLIDDRQRLSLTVDVAEGSVSAEVAANLGLIVTELVVNAIKHAFPHNAAGQINVDYRSDGSAWTLCVSDTGIGRAADVPDKQPGLGMTIVDSIANKLGATVEISQRTPGSKTTIIHG